MAKYRYSVAFLCLAILLLSGAAVSAAGEYMNNVAIGETDIKIDQSEFPPVAYLYVELKNSGDKKIANVNFEVSYYDAEGYLLQKAVLKNALTKAMPQKGALKYKIRLKGDVLNTEHEEYPYSQLNKVGGFDIKITGVKISPK
jgi:hypothetical protein